MAYQRKLGRTASQRKALLRGLTTNLINNGKIETTEAKAKEVRRIAERPSLLLYLPAGIVTQPCQMQI